MPKVLQCANCRKKFLYSTYQLMAHFDKCVLEVKNDSIRKTVQVTEDDSLTNKTKYATWC